MTTIIRNTEVRRCACGGTFKKAQTPANPREGEVEFYWKCDRCRSHQGTPWLERFFSQTQPAFESGNR